MSRPDDLSRRIGDLGRKTIFFVCGSMKSGTTWLQILLDAHPAISCGGEGHFSDKLTPILQDAVNDYGRYIDWKNKQNIGGLDGYPSLGAPHLTYLLRTAILLLFSEQSKGRRVRAVGEKTPDNISGMPLLNQIFPEAKFIHLVRDGRDCAASGWFHNSRLSPAWLAQEFPTMEAYAAATAKGWAREQAAAVAFARERPQRCLALRYEDLIEDTATAFRSVLTFLGMPHDAATIADCCAKSDFAKLSGGRAPGKEDRASFYRKGVAGDWRNHFSAEANAAFIREAGPWLTHFGYPL